jgi:hypothetical protein
MSQPFPVVGYLLPVNYPVLGGPLSVLLIVFLLAPLILKAEILSYLAVPSSERLHTFHLLKDNVLLLLKDNRFSLNFY